MSQASTLKSASITNMDATPPIRNTAGQGAVGQLRSVNDYVTTVTADTTASTYRLVRFRSNDVMKQVLINNDAMSTSTAMNVGVAYSDDPLDPNYSANAGAAISTTFFASAYSVSSATKNVDITFQSGSYTVALQNEPAWQALGLSADPGGYFDVFVTPSAAVTAGGKMGIELRTVAGGD